MQKKIRDIIEIDEERCTGCGQCVLDCAEGAIALVEGKARIVADIYCDGLGACLAGCPENALRVIRREAEAFDEEAVRARFLRQGRADSPFARPGALRWPLKIMLLRAETPFLKGVDLLVAADCAAFAAPDFHGRLAKGKTLLIGCPKFEGGDVLARQLGAIVRTAGPKSLLVVRMEVPCCKALSQACRDALKMAGGRISLREAVVGRGGEISGL